MRVLLVSDAVPVVVDRLNVLVEVPDVPVVVAFELVEEDLTTCH